MKYNKTEITRIMKELKNESKLHNKMVSKTIDNQVFSVGASGAYFYKNTNFKDRYFYNHSNLKLFVMDIETYFYY